jgi:L-ribulokinase
VAGSANGGFDDYASAQAAMTGVKDVVYKPIPENHAVYKKLYVLYKQLHDSFGLADRPASLANVMKDLLKIKEEAAG